MNFTPPRRRRDILDGFWHLASSTAVGMGLLMLAAATLAVAAAFPQLPVGLERATAERWLASTTGSYGGLGPALAGLGVFDVLAGTWLHVLLGLLAYWLLLRLAGQASYLLRMRRATPPARPRPTSLPQRDLTLPGPLDARLAQLQQVVRPRYRVIATDSEAARVARSTPSATAGLRSGRC